MPAQRKYPEELRERAVKMVLEIRGREGKGRGEIARVGRQLGIHPEALRTWIRQAEIDGGTRPGTTTEDSRRIAELEREVRELRRERDIEGGERLFREGTRPQASALVGFIDSHRGRFGVEPACAVLEFPVSTYYAAKKREDEPSRREGIGVARCTVARLMRELGIAGASAQRRRPRTTVPDAGGQRPADLLERD